MSDSPVDQLLDQLRATLHAGRADVLRRVEQLEHALVAYRNSAEHRVALDFATTHGLRRPGPAPLTSREAAERLLSLVQSLPELADEAAQNAEASPPEGSSRRVPDGGRPAAPERLRGFETNGSGASSSLSDASSSPSGASSSPSGASNSSSGAAPLAALTSRCLGRKLVVIGALAGRSKERLLPPLLEERTEWVDTERDGIHAIGNLAQRIRQDRVGAVVILDRAVQHKHTEPILAAARDTHTPVAFAGKGGRASLLRAVEQLDKRLET